MGEVRQIVHFDLDSFFVSVECLLDSRLKGRPVMVGGTGDRAVVASCSYEARKFGIHSAMPMAMARRLCPDAIVVRGDYDQYTKYSNIVTEIIGSEVPVFEKASIDEFYADLTGMDRFFGCRKLVQELRQKVMRETGLPISLGLSGNKTVSKVATGEAKPNGQLMIDFGLEKSFLSPLSVKKIPMVGEKTYQLLRGMGVEKVKTLQDMPMLLLERAMGEFGRSLWEKANAIDNSLVVPYNERKSISSEQTFQQDTADLPYLKSVVTAMTEDLLFKLRGEDKLTSCITIKIRYSDFETHTQQKRIAYTSADHHVLPRVLELLDRLYRRRTLVRLVGVRFSHLVQGSYQIHLFDDSPELINLYQAMDRINARYGVHTVARAIGEKGRWNDENSMGKVKR